MYLYFEANCPANPDLWYLIQYDMKWIRMVRAICIKFSIENYTAVVMYVAVPCILAV